MNEIKRLYYDETSNNAIDFIIECILVFILGKCLLFVNRSQDLKDCVNANLIPWSGEMFVLISVVNVRAYIICFINCEIDFHTKCKKGTRNYKYLIVLKLESSKLNDFMNNKQL